MRVLKFGGTSVADADRIRRAVEIVERIRRSGPLAVVVSALGGVTNALLDAATEASRRDLAWETRFAELKERHLGVAADLLAASAGENEAVRREIEARFADLHDLLRGVFLLRECSPRTADGVAGYGERLSSEIVAAALRVAGLDAEAIDTRDLVVTDDRFGQACVDQATTRDRLRARLLAADGAPRSTIGIVTGFLGATPEGHATTLGRGGSDYTAALVGAALDAEAIEIWTDVAGVYTADPRRVPDARPQPHLSYAELMELSHFGAKVVHPPTVHPARSQGIPLLIKSTFEPDAPGTLVTSEAAPAREAIRGITAVAGVALARLEGDGMVGVPGIAERLFGALARREVSAILISQSSSEHSICFAIAGPDAAIARDAVEAEFDFERRLGMIDPLVVEDEHTVIAAVGEQMAHRPGIAGQIFGVLGAHGVNVRAIAQGSSELNVSLVVEAREATRAVCAIHEAFFSPPRHRVDVVVAGVGRVGGELLRQLAEARSRLLEEDGLDLRLLGVVSSRKLLAVPVDDSPDGAAGLDPATAAERLAATDERDGDELAAALDALFDRADGAGKIFVDVTASHEQVERYVRLLERGVAVVAANKNPFSGPQSTWDALHGAAHEGGAALLFETTAGAALPLVDTLRGLRRTGDRVVRLDAVLSGTLNAVLDTLAADVPFSESVRRAFDAGLTEPRPYDDLSGFDVARKLILLARITGHRLEPDEVEVEPLLAADPWADLDLDAFWQRLPEVDDAFETRRAAADAEGKRLRFLAVFDPGENVARAGLEAVAAEHPAYDLTGPDNLVAIHTERAPASPMVIRGAGAGPAVTAGGVFADLLRASRFDRFPIPRGDRG